MDACDARREITMNEEKEHQGSFGGGEPGPVGSAFDQAVSEREQAKAEKDSKAEAPKGGKKAGATPQEP